MPATRNVSAAPGCRPLDMRFTFARAAATMAKASEPSQGRPDGPIRVPTRNGNPPLDDVIWSLKRTALRHGRAFDDRLNRIGSPFAWIDGECNSE